MRRALPDKPFSVSARSLVVLEAGSADGPIF
jgi:hypothetical protein